MSRRSPVGDHLCRIIHDQPGIHFRALERAASLQSTGQLRHHIDQLQRCGTVVEVSDGGFHRFFIAKDHDRRLRQRMVRFARPLAYRVARTLLRHEHSRTEIRRALGCADSTLGYYLNRMEEAGDIVRREGPRGPVYALADPQAVREVLEARGGLTPTPSEEVVKQRPATSGSAPSPAPENIEPSKQEAELSWLYR